MTDSVRPHRRQPTRLPRSWYSPGKNIGVGCHFLLQCVRVKLLSRIRVLANPWTAAHQAPQSMGFSRQEYWSGVPLPSPLATLEVAKLGFSGGASGKEPACQCRRRKKCKFDSWVGKIPWRRAWQAHFSILAWEIPWTEEPGGLQPRGLHRVRHD